MATQQDELLEELMAQQGIRRSTVPVAAVAAPAALAAPAAVASPARASTAAAESAEPRRRWWRRPTLDTFDRARIYIGAGAAWLASTAATVAAVAHYTGLPMGGAILAGVVVQVVLSIGELMVLRARVLVGMVFGLLLAGFDGLLNVVGADMLAPAITIAIDLTSPLFWTALAAGAIWAVLPEVFVSYARR